MPRLQTEDLSVLISQAFWKKIIFGINRRFFTDLILPISNKHTSLHPPLKPQGSLGGKQHKGPAFPPMAFAIFPGISQRRLMGCELIKKTRSNFCVTRAENPSCSKGVWCGGEGRRESGGWGGGVNHTADWAQQRPPLNTVLQSSIKQINRGSRRARPAGSGTLSWECPFWLV